MNPFNKLYERKVTTIPLIPLYLDIELTNKCNLKCKMCGTNYSKRRKGVMDNYTAQNILNYVKEYLIPIRIIGWGEPTLHQYINSWVETFMEYVPVHLNTNGYKKAPLVTSIKYSIHGQKFKPREDIEHIYYTTTDLENVKKIPDGCKINKTDTRWINGKNRSNKRFNRCGEVFDKLTIFWNGDITACCGDVEGTLILGNINNDNLIEIWKNSKQLNYMRKELRKKNWNCTELCKNCFNYT